MEVFLCDDVRKFDEEKYAFMSIPCCRNGLAVKKTNELQNGKCPVCGCAIYVYPQGLIMGHE